MRLPSCAQPLAERAALGALAVALIAAAPGGVKVRRDGARLSVEASAVPLSGVLDAIAAETRLQVEYEGAPPRQLVTLALHDRSPAEVVLGVLEGQGLDYALQLDATGHGVVRLLISAAGSANPSARRPRPPPRPLPAPVEPPFQPEADMPDEEEPIEEDAPAPLRPAGSRAGRPLPAPLLFPTPLGPPTATPTPEVQ